MDREGGGKKKFYHQALHKRKEFVDNKKRSFLKKNGSSTDSSK